MKKLILLLFIIFSFVAKADELSDFVYSEEWLYLLHYQKSGNGFKSSIDSDDFFLDKEGRLSPKKELEATISLFNHGDDGEKCNFPARYKLLKKKGLIKADFPRCEEMETIIKAVQPNGITLIFTNAYMNNPASLFGHTLIRIDTKRKGTQLLAHGANYGAYTGEDKGVMFAIKGIFGGYYGTFTIRPYYDIINTYNNIENRDIWEYELNFSEEELDMLISHLWELSKAKITYYFIDKNCSYMILELFDAIRPSLRLAEEFKFHTIPLDSLKAVNSREGFVKKINYRPSRQTKINYRVSKMTKNQYKSLLDIVKNDNFNIDNFSEEEKADILETAYQYVQYQLVDQKLELNEYRSKSFAILKERSKINAKPLFNELKEGDNPVYSHNSMEAGIMGGYRNGDIFQQISFKPLYNSLMSDSFGLLSGAEINFMEARLRHYNEENDFVLHNLDILKVKSLTPSSDLFSPLSFNLKIAVENFYNQIKDDDGYMLDISIGVGKSFKVAENTSLYFFSNTYLGYGGILPDNEFIGLGLTAGFYHDFKSFRANGEIEATTATDRIYRKIKYNLDLAYGITRNTYLMASYNFSDNEHGKNNREYLLGINFNF